MPSLVISDPDHLEEDIPDAEHKAGLDYLGSIHTHTIHHVESHVASTTDNEQCHAYEEKILRYRYSHEE